MHDPRKYLEPRPRWRAAIWTTAFALLAVSVWFGVAAWENLLLVEAQEEIKARQLAKTQPKPKAVPTRNELELQKRWASLERERSFAWYPILRALEETSSDDVELLEFSPDKQARRLVLRGEARDLGALLTYVQVLSEETIFQSVYLARQKNKVSGALTTVEFEVRAQLR